jgi:hypothetical protein
LGLFTLNKPWSVNWPKPGYASITFSTISNIPYNLIFTTKFNDSSILITIISCDYLNLSLAEEHVGDVTVPTISSITNIFSRGISQSDWNIQIKLNYRVMVNNSIYIEKSKQLFYTSNDWIQNDHDTLRFQSWFSLFTGTKSGGIKPIVIYILFEKIIILLLFIEGWG